MTLDYYVKDPILSLLLSLLIEPITNMPLPLNVNVCPIVGVVSVSLCLSVTFRREKRNQVNQYYAENVSLSLYLFIPSSSLSLLSFLLYLLSHIHLVFILIIWLLLLLLLLLLLFIIPPPLLSILIKFLSPIPQSIM